MMIDLSKILKISVRCLVITSWVSGVVFGLYILGFYFVSFFLGNLDNWNLGLLPGLYDKENTRSTFGMGLHFAAGGLILVLGCIQLVDQVRLKFPQLHRYIGRIYVVSSLMTAIGGILFIIFKGCVGGLWMDIGFGLYGLLMFISALMTWKYAIGGNIKQHREWALRLFVLAIGSWLYRIESGVIRIFIGNWGHTPDFQGTTDIFMNFFFYLPNLLVVELYMKLKWRVTNKIVSAILILLTWGGIFLVAVASYFLFIKRWVPNLMQVFG
jgi:hypothetical protein